MSRTFVWQPTNNPQVDRDDNFVANVVSVLEHQNLMKERDEARQKIVALQGELQEAQQKILDTQGELRDARREGDEAKFNMAKSQKELVSRM